LPERSQIDDELDDDGAAGSAASTILVVNDDHDSCELIARLIESDGWRAQRCYVPDDAIKSLDRPLANFTAVIVDLSDGLTGGVPVLDAARRQPPPRGAVPVLLLSSRADDETVAWDAGADGVLIRPFHANDFLDGLRSVLARTPDERAQFRAAKTAG
jgi:DNA-binding response OmpR family regulator